MRPRAVRTRKPCWIRYGSITSSSVPRSSDSDAASDSTPTGPPSKWPMMVLSSRRSSSSKPSGSTLSMAMAACATLVDAPAGPDLGVVTHPAQQAVGDARRAARAAGDLAGAIRFAVDAQDPRRTAHDPGQLLGRVELQALDDAEAVAQRRGQQAGAGGGADQGERRQVELDRARGRALADHDVDLEVLHRRIEHLL